MARDFHSHLGFLGSSNDNVLTVPVNVLRQSHVGLVFPSVDRLLCRLLFTALVRLITALVRFNLLEVLRHLFFILFKSIIIVS